MKRSLVVEADGGPLGAAIDGANVHDAKLLKRTLQAIVVPKPRPTPRKKQHLCLDKGYAVVGEPSRTFLWILSRTPQMDDETYGDIVESLPSFGYDPDRLELVPQAEETD